MESNQQQWPVYLRTMTSPEIGALARQAPIALLCVGSIEQHGAHLPVETDLAVIEYLAVEGLQAARRSLGVPVGVVAPSLPYGGPGIGMNTWTGTICLKPATLIEAVFDVGGGLVAAGFRYVLVLNGCVGNIPALTLAVQKLKAERPQGDFILVGSDWEMPEVLARVRTSASGGLGHACELETSTMLALDPSLVKMERAVREHIAHPSPDVSFDFDHANPFYWPYPFQELTQSGVIGDPTQATREKGEIVLAANASRVADVLGKILEIDRNRKKQ